MRGPAINGLAVDLHRSRQQVYNYAKAGATYRFLRRWAGLHGSEYVKMLHTSRPLGHSFFNVAGVAFQQFEMEPGELLSDLHTAALNGANIIDFRRALWGQYQTDVVDWHASYKRIARDAERLAEGYGVPPPLQQAAREFLAACEKITV